MSSAGRDTQCACTGADGGGPAQPHSHGARRARTHLPCRRRRPRRPALHAPARPRRRHRRADDRRRDPRRTHQHPDRRHRGHRHDPCLDLPRARPAPRHRRTLPRGSVGLHRDGPVTVEALPGLGLIDRVLNEVCRRHAALFLMRRTTAPITLGSVHVPQGADIGYSIHALHHDQRHYTGPDRFDPDRWLPGRQADLPKGAFIPFSAGNAKCVGDGFAWTEMKIVLATLLSRWHLRQAPGNIVGESLATIPRPTHLTMSVESATAAGI
nr:cytochrome P450 [Streptomyces sp. MAA16]